MAAAAFVGKQVVQTYIKFKTSPGLFNSVGRQYYKVRTGGAAHRQRQASRWAARSANPQPLTWGQGCGLQPAGPPDKARGV